MLARPQAVEWSLTKIVISQMRGCLQPEATLEKQQMPQARAHYCNFGGALYVSLAQIARLQLLSALLVSPAWQRMIRDGGIARLGDVKPRAFSLSYALLGDAGIRTASIEAVRLGSQRKPRKRFGAVHDLRKIIVEEHEVCLTGTL